MVEALRVDVLLFDTMASNQSVAKLVMCLMPWFCCHMISRRLREVSVGSSHWRCVCCQTSCLWQCGCSSWAAEH